MALVLVQVRVHVVNGLVLGVRNENNGLEALAGNKKGEFEVGPELSRKA